MSDFKANMHQIVCRLGLRPTPRRGSFSTALPQTPSWIFGGILLREVRGGDPLLSRYTPIHYILDKGLRRCLASQTLEDHDGNLEGHSLTLGQPVELS